MVGFDIIAKFIIILITMVSLIVIAILNIPKTETLISDVISFMPSFDVAEDPCLYHCFTVQEGDELRLIRGGLDTYERDYNSAVYLPTFFSCNYDLLRLATHAFELSRWEMAKPQSLVTDINCSDALYLSVYGATAANICTLVFGASKTEFKFNCSLVNSTDGLFLSCPSDCYYNDIYVNYTVNTSSNACVHNLLNDSLLPEGRFPCEMVYQNIGLNRFCEQYSDLYLSYPECEVISYDVNTTVCDLYYYCKTTSVAYKIGGTPISCHNISCTTKAGVATCDYGTCKNYTDAGYVSCDPPRVCKVNYNTTLCKIEKDTAGEPLLKCKPTKSSTTYTDCTIVYAANDCIAICDSQSATLGKFAQQTYYELKGAYVHPSSSYLFDSIKGLKVNRIYRQELGKSHDLYDDVYSLLVEPNYIIIPRDRIVNYQEGLKTHTVSANPFKNIDDTVKPLENNPFQGEVTNPRYFENATKFIYDCVSRKSSCDSSELLTFSNFCYKDDFLKNYGYINCLEDLTLSDKLDPKKLTYLYRRGDDISRGFYCSEFTYDACSFEPDKYDYDSCWPSWAVLRSLGHKGRCEDFALLYYSLFRTMGIPEDGTILETTEGQRVVTPDDLSVSLEFSHCDIPCPCKLLFDHCGIDYEQTLCAAPQYVTLNTFGTFDACPTSINGYPIDSDTGFYLNGSIYSQGDYTIVQNFDLRDVSCYDYACSFDQGTSNVTCHGVGYSPCTIDGSTITCKGMPCQVRSYNPVFFNKRFSGDESFLGNDFFVFGKGFNAINYNVAGGRVYGNELCDSYKVTADDLTTLIAQCSDYVKVPYGSRVSDYISDWVDDVSNKCGVVS